MCGNVSCSYFYPMNGECKAQIFFPDGCCCIPGFGVLKSRPVITKGGYYLRLIRIL